MMDELECMNIYEIVSVVSITAFYGVYAVKQIAMRKKGIDTARLGKGDKPRKVAMQERLLAGVTLLAGIMQYAAVFSSNSMLPLNVAALPLQFAGTVVCAVGTIYFAAAVLSMHGNWRAGIDATQKTSLVETGIYRFSRNPAFVGFDLMYIGFAMVWPNWPLAIISVLAVVLLHLQIIREEAYLEGKFGEEYLNYKKRTLRY